MIAAHYQYQVDLLLRVLPLVASEPVFALKGGTAINMFEHNMPRLSVDIDLTYLPLNDRAVAMQEIAQALERIRMRIEKSGSGVQTRMLRQAGAQETKIICINERAQIKIEVNTIIRGHLFPVRLMDIAEEVEAEFGRFVSMPVVSRQELFGGKLCAALDRQHPRDLFDVYQLFEHEGLTKDITGGFLAMLLSHSRPIHELLSPHRLDQSQVFQEQFSGMTTVPFSYADYEETRTRMIDEISAGITTDEKRFLLSFAKGDPDWSLQELDRLQHMPAIQWKLRNMAILKERNPAKYALQFDELEKVMMGD
jgi:predicted nucleotidyltransferase component of viral defense system